MAEPADPALAAVAVPMVRAIRSPAPTYRASSWAIGVSTSTSGETAKVQPMPTSQPTMLAGSQRQGRRTARRRRISWAAGMVASRTSPQPDRHPDDGLDQSRSDSVLGSSPIAHATLRQGWSGRASVEGVHAPGERHGEDLAHAQQRPFYGPALSSIAMARTWLGPVMATAIPVAAATAKPALSREPRPSQRRKNLLGSAQVGAPVLDPEQSSQGSGRSAPSSLPHHTRSSPSPIGTNGLLRGGLSPRHLSGPLCWRSLRPDVVRCSAAGPIAGTFVPGSGLPGVCAACRRSQGVGSAFSSDSYTLCHDLRPAIQAGPRSGACAALSVERFSIGVGCSGSRGSPSSSSELGGEDCRVQRR